MHKNGSEFIKVLAWSNHDLPYKIHWLQKAPARYYSVEEVCKLGIAQ